MDDMWNIDGQTHALFETLLTLSRSDAPTLGVLRNCRFPVSSHGTRAFIRQQDLKTKLEDLVVHKSGKCSEKLELSTFFSYRNLAENLEDLVVHEIQNLH